MGKDNRNFGEEVGEGLISGLPMALNISKGIFKGMTKATQMLRDKVLTEEELEEIREEEAQKEKEISNSSGILGSLKSINNESMQATSNLAAIGRSLFNKAINRNNKEQ